MAAAPDSGTKGDGAGEDVLKEIKFMARIPERNTTIYFTLYDLVKPEPLFSIREILKPWLLAGNQPELI